MELNFLTEDLVRQCAKQFGTPCFVYSYEQILKRIEQALSFPNSYGLTVRYAMKANPNRSILKILRSKGVHIDASSEFEVERALAIGFLPNEIMLTSQQFPKRLKEWVEKGVFFNACSLHQLEQFGQLFPKGKVSIRINPGLGSGHTVKTDVGGTHSSFGIWHELMPQVDAIREKYSLQIVKVHTHIGSGSDPEVWKAVAHYTLEYAARFPECQTVNLGGGFKVARMPDEKTTDLQKIGKPIQELFEQFFATHNRALHLEIEPGTHMIANCGSLISAVDDVVHTGSLGYEFLKLDTGMDANTRPSLYGARHPLITVPKENTNQTVEKDYIVVGHCCESGDVFTQEMGGNAITRKMKQAKIGDYVVMEGVGAYCSSMSTKNYNSFPETMEVMLMPSGEFKIIRKRQELHQIYQNEIDICTEEK